MPAMRQGDAVIAPPSSRVPGLDVEWLDAGEGVRPRHVAGQHATDAWLQATGRTPWRHRLLPRAPRELLVLAPSVQSSARQWHGWNALSRHLTGAVWLGAHEPREEWMSVLNRAHTVVCPDTGTVHMADALGVPNVVGLYGAGFARHAPYWDRSRCIERRGLAVSVDEVLEHVNA